MAAAVLTTVLSGALVLAALGPASAQAGRHIKGQAFQEYGSRQPLGDIRVLLIHEASRQLVDSDVTQSPHGEFQMYDMAAEDHLLRFIDQRPCQRAHASQQLRVSRQALEGGTVRRNVFLVRGATIFGVVRDLDGNPLRGASVSVAPDSSFGGGTVTTGRDGRYEFCRLGPQVHAVTAASDGEHQTVPRVRLSEGERRRVDFTFGVRQAEPPPPPPPTFYEPLPPATEVLGAVVPVAQVTTATPPPTEVLASEEAPALPVTGPAMFLLYATIGSWVVLGGMLLRQSARRRYRLLTDLDGYV